MFKHTDGLFSAPQDNKSKRNATFQNEQVSQWLLKTREK